MLPRSPAKMLFSPSPAAKAGAARLPGRKAPPGAVLDERFHVRVELVGLSPSLSSRCRDSAAWPTTGGVSARSRIRSGTYLLGHVSARARICSSTYTAARTASVTHGRQEPDDDGEEAARTSIMAAVISISGRRCWPAISGWRAMASTALPPMRPMPQATADERQAGADRTTELAEPATHPPPPASWANTAGSHHQSPCRPRPSSATT